ncbi:Crp/Fnr family transcriptional regulator [Paenibacillus flagellatus]|uniref:Crp/Fnr family transcriptional regulator n=1 Tax=Paenibacillus flagellatus TaxID=2211139 RepID=A0A2V5JZZ7_9BACL|nr:Crp/Fnr family transcriptional regulator [Paenibacillus flagellatus]PYI52535.1 hypothetical protein DLM86_20385 [Paenibacillus flagellatus]
MTTTCAGNIGQSETASASGLGALLSADHFRMLSGIMYGKTASAGTTLFWEGDPTGKLYYIRSGRVKVRKTTEDGREFILSILKEGDFCGELGGFGETVHGYSAEVTEEAELGIVQERDLEVLLMRHGDFAVEFMKWMSLQNRIVQSKFRDLLLYGKPGALASTLIRMSNTFGIPCEEGIRIDLKMTNAEMADLIGTTRESVNRMLSAMREEGTISVSHHQIVIRNIDGLRRICHCPSYPACPKEICRL